MDLDMVPALSLLYTVKGGNTYSVPGKCSEMLATIVVMLVMVKPIQYCKVKKINNNKKIKKNRYNK